MRNTIKIAIGILTMALLLGITVIGCNDDDPSNDPALIGTWVTTDDDVTMEVKFYGSNYEVSIINGYSYDLKKVTCPTTKGTYTTDSGIITTTPTHYYGELYGLESRWYSKNEKSALVTVFKNIGLSDDEIELMLFEPQAGTYSVNGNTLNLQGDYFTKK